MKRVSLKYAWAAVLLLFSAVLTGGTWTEQELDKYRAERAEWENNSLGKGDGRTVMQPWIPVTFAKNTLHTLMWDYAYDRTLLPSQMSYKGTEPILSAAPYFVLTADGGRDIVLKRARMKSINVTPEVAEIVTEAEDSGVTLTLRTATEFDGMSKVTMSLSAKDASRKFTGLRLVLPMKEDYSVNYHYYIAGHHPIRPFNQSGAVPAKGFRLDTFRTLVWLGNTRMGLCFFSEGIRDWPLADEKGIEEVTPVRKGSRELIVRFANRPFTLEKPLELVFGIQATPAKERERDFRRRSDFSTLDWVWWHWADASAHPFLVSPEAKTYIAAQLAKGLEVMPYSSTHYYGVYFFGKSKFGVPEHPGMILPEIKLWGAEWQKKPLPDKKRIRLLSALAGKTSIDPTDPADDMVPESVWKGKMYMPRALVELCPKSGFQDYYIWRLNEAIEKSGLTALYLDSGINSCLNSAHGCGYVDYTGKWRESAPIFAGREMIKRIRRLFLKKHGKSRICLHVSCHLEVPFLSFVDSHLGAEQYAYEPFSVQEFYGDLMTPEIMLAEHIGIPFGVAEEFLPVFNFFWRDYRAPSPASVRDLCGLSFVHDVNPSAKDTPYNDLIRFYQAKRLAFFPECDQVARYWEKQNVFSTAPEHVKGIVHWNNRHGLAVLYNWSGKVTHATLALDARAIFGRSGTLRLTDIVSGESFTPNDGKTSVPLAPHDFRMFEISLQ